jgi:hypothetical protein
VITSLRPKPVYGSPCNSCGLCCIAEQCPLSLAVFGERPICPALAEPAAEPGALVCGLIVEPERFLDMPRGVARLHGDAFALMLGAGKGCDGIMTDEDRAARDADGDATIERTKEAIRSAPPSLYVLVMALIAGLD